MNGDFFVHEGNQSVMVLMAWEMSRAVSLPSGELYNDGILGRIFSAINSWMDMALARPESKAVPSAYQYL
jgi:hypothetical protein